MDFGTLKEGEVDSGNEAREMGEAGLFEELAQQNIKTFKQFSVKKIITISPHDYHTFRIDYPKLGMEVEGVYHYTEIIGDLIRKGKIKLTKEILKTVSFQDPCHLGRYHDIYEAPRDIIKAVPGVKFVEMSRNHDDAFCCGAGGEAGCGMILKIAENNEFPRLESTTQRMLTQTLSLPHALTA